MAVYLDHLVVNSLFAKSKTNFGVKLAGAFPMVIIQIADDLVVHVDYAEHRSGHHSSRRGRCSPRGLCRTSSGRIVGLVDDVVVHVDYVEPKNTEAHRSKVLMGRLKQDFRQGESPSLFYVVRARRTIRQAGSTERALIYATPSMC